MKILFVVVSGLLVACAPEGRLPAEPEQIAIDRDDLRQTQDVSGYMPLMEPPTAETLGQFGISAKVGSVRTARAWVEPNPSNHKFTHENPFWQTFTVKATSGIDSVYVLANPRIDGIVDALETAGGNEPPFRNFCPAEWNDSPTRARRDGWNLHLSACKKGKTYLLLYGWNGRKLDLYNIYPITVK